jgi:hypothetical protein
LTISRGKRWNGSVDTLTPTFLNGVIEQMLKYGDRVQFTLTTAGAKPNYQLFNQADKKISFDGNHHIHHPNDDEFDGVNVSVLLSLEQIRAAALGVDKKTVKGAAKSASGKRPARTTTASVRAGEVIDAARYAYFKEHRATLPATIGEHTVEITQLIRDGLSAEAAFAEVIKRHF